jgi:valyl-tRNA synthetase
VRDKLGRKMSKSLGNSPDPLDLIAQYGADALRFGVMRSAPLGQDVLFDVQHVELGRNFCNKLYNACRYRQMQGGEVEGEIDAARLTPDDKWILLRLDQAIRDLDTAFAEYRFNDAAQAIYRFFWSEFCDWYLESTKPALSSTEPDRRASTLAVIDFVLGHTLRLLHPFLPFITEELWHGLGYHEELPPDQGGVSIMHARWPRPFDADFREHYGLDASDAAWAEARYELVRQGRNLRREYQIGAGRKVRFVLQTDRPLAPHDLGVLQFLLGAEPLEQHAHWEAPKGTPVAHTPLGDLHLPLAGLVDLEAERKRLKKELEKIEAEIAKVHQKLANEEFVRKAPPHVLEENRKRLHDFEAKKGQLQSALDRLETSGEA